MNPIPFGRAELESLRARLLYEAARALSRAARERILKPYRDNAEGMERAHEPARTLWAAHRRAEYEAARELLLDNPPAGNAHPDEWSRP